LDLTDVLVVIAYITAVEESVTTMASGESDLHFCVCEKVVLDYEEDVPRSPAGTGSMVRLY
jgi:hypothetical protein